MRWRNLPASATASPIVPGQVYEVSVSLWNTSYIFNKGHSIRVAISSSNFPRYSANPNNGAPLSRPDVAKVVARNNLHIASAMPSRLVLPVVDMKTQLPPFPVLSDQLMGTEEGVKEMIKMFSTQWML